MIKPNELRLLNWVKYDNRYFQIHSIAYVFPTLNTDEFGIGVVDYNNIQPVELTPDILEAAGFTNGIKTIETSFLETEFYVDLMDGDAGFNKHGLWFPCKYLHQLQNLYYCLTGEELQIDLTKIEKL